MKVRVILVGAAGYWGRNYIRILNEHPNVELVFLADLNEDATRELSKQHHISWGTGIPYGGVIVKYDAAVICTPVTTHLGIVADMLDFDNHVLVEKAFSDTSIYGEAMVSRAKKKGLVLAVGHTYEHNSYVQEIKRMLDEGYLGDIYYVNMTRVGNSPLRNDVGCIYDLAAHDISMLLYWFDEMPESVTAFGQSYLQDGLEDVGYINLRFSKNKIANIRCSWVNPIKRRNVTIVGSKRMVSFDDVARTLEVYEGDKKEVLNIEYKEPLKEQVNDFIDAIISNREPKVNGERGLNVVRVLEQCQQSLRSYPYQSAMPIL